MTYTEICTRILYEAQRGGEAAEQSNLNSRTVIESIMPSVLQEVALKYAADPEKQSLLRRTHTVTLAVGVGTLPDEVLTGCVWGSTVWVPSDVEVGPLMSFTPWVSFIEQSDDGFGLVGKYSIRGDNELYWVDPGEVYTPGSGRTGNVEVTIASVPVIPANPDTEVDWPDEVQSDVIDLASEWLRGAAIAA